jgi:hypothetical protein
LGRQKSDQQSKVDKVWTKVAMTLSSGCSRNLAGENSVFFTERLTWIEAWSRSIANEAKSVGELEIPFSNELTQVIASLLLFLL